MQAIQRSLLLALSFSFSTGWAFGQHLTLIEQDYEKAKKESIAQQKLLLVDFYTTWCIPCKQLDKSIFRDSAIAAGIGKDFVVLRYDAEKDSTHQLSLKYHINFYPTTLVLNKNQLVLHRLYGFGGPDEDLVKNYRAFLQEAITADASQSYIKGVSSRNHLDFPAFYQSYVYRTDTKDIDLKVKNYWDTVHNYMEEVPFAVLSYFAGGSDRINTFFLENRKQYEAQYGKLDVLFIVTMVLNKMFDDMVKSKSRTAFAAASKIVYEHLPPAEAANFISQWDDRLLQAENKWDVLQQRITDRKQQGKITPDQLVRFCSAVLDNSSDQEVIKQCVAWMKEITGQKDDYSNTDLYARLLYKAGDTASARSQMEKAIALGKQAKENTKSSEDWLKKNKAQ